MVLLDILEEHLDEAAFHWGQWEQTLVAPDFTLAETAEREERLLAHLEALEDEAATDTVLRPAFESEEPTRMRCWSGERWTKCCSGSGRPAPKYVLVSAGRWSWRRLPG